MSSFTGFFFQIKVWGGGGGQKIKQKSSENGQLTGHFQSFFFFIISRINSKISMVHVNQQPVLNL